MFQALEQGGPMKIATFWLAILLLGISLSTAIFSIYWMAIAGSKIWLNAIGGALVATNFFLMLLSLASMAFLALSMLGFKIVFDGFTRQLFAVSTFIAQILCCVLMSLATETETDRCLKELEDYCIRNAELPLVVDFMKDHSTSYSRYSFVARITTEAYSSIASLFGIWFPLTIFYLYCAIKIGNDPLIVLNKEAAPADQTPLTQQQNNEAVPIDPEDRAVKEEKAPNQAKPELAAPVKETTTNPASTEAQRSPAKKNGNHMADDYYDVGVFLSERS